MLLLQQGKTVNVRWTNRQALATVFHEVKMDIVPELIK